MNDGPRNYGCAGTIITNIIFFVLLMAMLGSCASLFDSSAP